MSFADTSLQRHVAAKSVLILMVIVSNVCFDFFYSYRCQEDNKTSTLPKDVDFSLFQSSPL